MKDLIQSLPAILRLAGDAEEVAEAAAFVAWRRAAGDNLRFIAVPFKLTRKTLAVAVPDKTWQHNLEAMSGQMLFRINSLLGAPVVTYIDFRIAPEVVERERREHNFQRPSNDNHEARERIALGYAATLERAAAQIKDEDLRRRFLLAAGTSLEAKAQRNNEAEDL